MEIKYRDAKKRKGKERICKEGKKRERTHEGIKKRGLKKEIVRDGRKTEMERKRKKEGARRVKEGGKG